MTQLSISLPLTKKAFRKQLQMSIGNGQNDLAIELLSLAFGNWMLSSDEKPLFSLREMLRFPHEFFIQAVAERMCDHGLSRNFAKFWEMVRENSGKTWVYEIVMLVYTGLPRYGNYQKILAEIKSSKGYVPDELEVVNAAKCWDYLYRNSLSPQRMRKLRIKYRSLLHSNKNKELLMLLQTVEHEFHF